MDVAIDPAKDAFNRAKHKLALAFGIFVLGDRDALHVPDERFEYGEERVVCIGRVARRVYVAVYVRHGETVRFISVRRANRREQRRYDQA